MTRPILDSDIRPTMLLKKRSGVFNTGGSEYRPKGQFRIAFDENRTTVVEAVLDNVPAVDEVRTLDALRISDRLLVVMDGTDTVEYALFNGPITDIEYDRKTTTLKVTARDTSFIGASTIVNDILHQKFTDSFETTLDESATGEYTVTLPTDTDLTAPIVVQNRVAYGNPLRSIFNNKTALDMDLVYSAPLDSYQFRGTQYPDVDPSNGAKKYVAQTFTVKRDTQITNLFFPIAQYVRLYPNENPVSGEWNFNGIYAIQNLIDIPEAGEINTSTHSMPYTRMGPENKLRVSLVKCVRSSGAEALADRSTVTKSGRDVESREFVPTFGAPGDEHRSYIEGSFHDGFFSAEDLEKEPAQVLATIEISPTEPIEAPHYPAGEVPKVTHHLGELHDDATPTNNEAYTMFGWNLESTPINAEQGDILALIFEQLGDEVITSPLTDGVEPANKTNPDSKLSPSNFWAVGISRKLAGTGIEETNTYDDGTYLIAGLTEMVEGVRQYVGTHGMEAYRPTLDSDYTSPGYNGKSDAGVWEYNDKINLQNDLTNWNGALDGAIDALEGTINFLADPTGIFNQGTLARPGDLPSSLMTSGYFQGLHTLSDMYFSVITGSWLRLGRGLYWDVDNNGKVNFASGSVDWTPFSTNRYGLNMAKVSVYENPATGGLLDANNKSSVYDVANAIIAKIPKWDNIIVDGVLDGVDDAEGVGYNDPSVHPMSYWAMHEESAWNSLQRLADETEASISFHTDMSDVTTIIFESRKDATDFQYDSPSEKEVTISSRDDDPSWMKYLVSSRIGRDIESMYTKFRVIGSQQSNVTDTHYSLGLPVGGDQPIVFELEIPENLEELGFDRIKEFKSETNIKTHDQALVVANAAKLLYGNDTFSGTIELAGLHPLRMHSTLGLMIDTNSIVRLLDAKSPSGAAESGLDNVFRITGISYSSLEHKTDFTISTSVTNREIKEAKSIIDNLNKKTTTAASKHLIRLADSTFYTQQITMPATFTDGTIAIKLDDAEGGGGNLSAALEAKFLLDVGETKSAGATGHIIAVVPPGLATISSDLNPWLFGEITYDTTASALSGIAEPPFYFTLDKVYKYSADTLTIIVPVTLS